MDTLWDKVFDLMWEAYCAGTIPVGAVVADESGEVICQGRNRTYDVAFEGELAGIRMAHAEVNALSQLTSDRTYEGHTLYSTLEPCHLCLSAAFAVRVGKVRYAAEEPYGGGVGKLIPSIDHIRHPVVIEGPLDDSRGAFAGAVQIAHFLWRLPGGRVVAYYSELRPDLVAAARLLPPPDAKASLAEAFSTLDNLAT